MRTKTPGQLKVLVADITQNKHGFEHKLSFDLVRELGEAGVKVFDSQPAFLQEAAEFSQKLEDARADFNCLLLVAHGGRDQGSGMASVVVGPPGVLDWYSLVEISECLQDKFVALCVCYGHCEDSVSAFVDRNSLCLSLVASSASWGAAEALAFFPPFLRDLKSISIENIDPNDIQWALDRTNHLAHGKMKLKSDGLSIV